MRKFKDVEYVNCDSYTEQEMEVIADWPNATKEQKQAIRDKSHWRKSDLYQKD